MYKSVNYNHMYTYVFFVLQNTSTLSKRRLQAIFLKNHQPFTELYPFQLKGWQVLGMYSVLKKKIYVIISENISVSVSTI